ncbi:hypothetical protein O6H91_02G125700 [Diphasiastrum complanatum]|uniref:Uncharacterized protein n=3 Tax=Diphasiastrum complanatum TaxID=34168 RepID=A0ACC2EKI5_DIPCM|nr:hypothetical protein O6H91_02G125700 [Diphasiastrum complanatum]KAJ7566962.1 hypothetical protein O6H91_02G125700 [Diphasiastrum complanatum]
MHNPLKCGMLMKIWFRSYFADSKPNILRQSEAHFNGQRKVRYLTSSNRPPQRHVGQQLRVLREADFAIFDQNFLQLCKERKLKEALQKVEELDIKGSRISEHFVCRLLQLCLRNKDAIAGRRVRSLMLRQGLESNALLGNHLIRLFSLTGSIEEANQAFNRILTPDEYAWSAIISAHARHGQGERAIELYHQMLKSQGKPNDYIYVAVLKACSSTTNLPEGRIIHAHVTETGYESNIFVGSTLVDMYAKCGVLEEARRIFGKLLERDLVSWNAIIAGHAQHGLGWHTLELFKSMQEEGIKPDSYTYVSVLKACGAVEALHAGKMIHNQISKSAPNIGIYVGSALVDMYVKCGSLDEARQVFEKLPKRDVVSWNTMIGGYAQQGLGERALQMFKKMQQEGIRPDSVLFVSILNACASIGAIDEGKMIHAQIIGCRLQSDIFVGSALVDMYSKCANLVEARQVFDNLPRRDVVAWNAMLAGYAQHGHGQEALQLFEDMQRSGFKPNDGTYVSILKACGSIRALDDGKLIHAEIVEGGLETDPFIGSTLVDMYAKCGSLEKAREVFDKFTERNAVLYNTMISGYAQIGLGLQALEIFKKMQDEAIKPDNVTYISILKACGRIAAVDEGKLIHAQILKTGLQSDTFIGSSIIDMYVSCGSLEEAHRVFENLEEKDVVSWNALIAGYAQHGQGQHALELFKRMQQEGMSPNETTYVAALKACSNIAALDEGKLIHAQILKAGLELDINVGRSLVDMYAKCDNVDAARQVFDGLLERDVFLWNAIIGGYAQCGLGHQALEFFENMQHDNQKPDAITFVNILKACGSIAAIEDGRMVHSQIVKSGLKLDSFVGSTLIDMYAKCGCLEMAHQVFDNLTERSTVSWNVMIGGYAQHGLGQQALQLFERMQQEGANPDHVTFVGVLSACSHSSLLDEGLHFFESMSKYFKIAPRLQHYACMVDLLSRTGNLSEAEMFMQEMPIQPDTVMWMSLLGACQTHCNVEIGRRCFESIMRLNPKHTPAYILMSNIYAAAGQWESKKEIRKKMESAGMKKVPGFTWTESWNQIDPFTLDA